MFKKALTYLCWDFQVEADNDVNIEINWRRLNDKKSKISI